MSYDLLEGLEPDDILCGRCLRIAPHHHDWCEHRKVTQYKGIKLGPRGHIFFLDAYEQARFSALKIVYHTVPEDLLKVAVLLGEDNRLAVHEWVDRLFPRHLRLASTRR